MRNAPAFARIPYFIFCTERMSPPSLSNSARFRAMTWPEGPFQLKNGSDNSTIQRLTDFIWNPLFALSRKTLLMSIRYVSRMLVLAALLGTVASLRAADLSELITGPVEKVVGECKFTEGPAWHPDGYLLFSDIPNNRIIRVNPDGTHSDWLTQSGGANGLMCDAQGNVYAAQGDAQQIGLLRSRANGKGQLIAVLTKTYDGKPYNKPNDLALDADGGLYFTDPNYRKDPPSQPVEGVYYLSRKGRVTRVIDDLPRPNGVLVSPNGKTLYVANIELRQIMAYPIVGAGQISKGTVLFEGDPETDGRGPDGMAIDTQGNIYATYKQLVVLTSNGQLIGRVSLPEKPANCVFGGKNNSTLYITARTSLYKVNSQATGMALQPRGPMLAFADKSETEPTSKDKEETIEVKLPGITLQIPKSWKKERPTSRLRLAQFSIPAVSGDKQDSELAVFPPFGGSIQANVERWISQFESKGRELKMTQGSTEQGRYVLVELTGTYKRPIGPPFARMTQPTPNWKMMAVILSSKEGGNFFLKLTGPQKTVASVSDAFRHSFGATAAEEKEYKLP